MTHAQLVKMIAAREGKKSQVKVGDIREILAILTNLDYEHLKRTGGDGTGPLDMLMKRSTAKFMKSLKAKNKK